MLATLLILLHLLPLDRPENHKGKAIVKAFTCVGGSCHVPKGGR